MQDHICRIDDLEYEADPERYDSGTSCETNVEPNYPGGNAVVACDGGAVRSDCRAESHSGLATILANLSEPTRDQQAHGSRRHQVIDLLF